MEYPVIESVQENGCMTVVAENEDGTRHYESLVPGQFDKAQRLLPAELYEQVEEMWTEETVAAYRESLKTEENDHGEL